MRYFLEFDYNAKNKIAILKKDLNIKRLKFCKSLFFTSLFLLFLTLNGVTQEVLVSEEINIRNDYSYELLGKVQDRIVILRNQGYGLEMDVLDDQLQHLWNRELRFFKKRYNSIGVVPRDSFFTVFYTYKSKGYTWIRARSFDSEGIVKDTASIQSDATNVLTSRPRFKFSKNKKYSVLYDASQSTNIDITVIDNDSLTVISNDEIIYTDINVRKDFKTLEISDAGDVMLVFEKNNSRNRKKDHFYEINFLPFGSEEIYGKKLFFRNMLSSSVKFSYDALNKKVVLAGLFHNKNKQDALGYFYTSLDPINGDAETEIQKQAFEQNLLNEVYGNKRIKDPELKNYIVKELVHRADGGFLLVAEMHKEHSRRSTYGSTASYARNDFYSRGDWVDYYDEDILVFNINPDGSQLWTQLFQKKQFSQDDEGIFSSFFMFRNNNRLRFLFNDEIKDNSTCSEYILDPVGNYERKALFSTEEQKLKLRFKDALQISKNEVLIPSEKSYALSIVKISY